MSEVIATTSFEKNTLQAGMLAWAYCRATGLFVPLNCDANGNLGTSAAAGGATAANQAAELVLIGPVNETAPASDTASSGLNGRLQRIAQRITSFIALFPASLGQKAKAASLAVTLASDQDALALAQPSDGALTKGSDDISSGGTSQVVFVAKPNRKYLIVQNLSAEDMALEFEVSADANSSLKLLPGGSYERSAPGFVPTDAISIVAATTGSKFAAYEG